MDYLRARHHWQRYSEPEIRTALALLDRALYTAPDYAPALAGLALCHVALGWLGAEPPGVTFPRGREAALRALAHDPDLAEAYCALGYVATFYEWNAQEATRALGRAAQLQPGSADVHLFTAWFRTSVGDHAGALAETRLALTLDPLSTLALGNAAYLAIFDRRYDDAERHARQALAFDPSSLMEQWSLGIALALQGRTDEGAHLLERVVDTWPGAPMLGWLGYVYARAGERRRAEDLLERLRSLAQIQVVGATEIGRVLAGLGDVDGALAALSDACERREGALGYLGSDPCWDAIAGDPRFAALLRRRGLAARSRPALAGTGGE